MNNLPLNKPLISQLIICCLLMLMACIPALHAEDAETARSFERKLPLAFLHMDGLYNAANGNTYAAGGFNGTDVYQIMPDGSTVVFATGLAGPIDIAEDSSGNLYVTNFFSASVSKIDASGEVTHFADTVPFPSGIVADQNGNFYVSQFGVADPQTGLGTGDVIQKIDANGVASTFAQGDLLSAPVGITMDAAGNVYTANLHNGRIIKIDPSGQQHFVARPTPPEAVFAIGHLEYAGNRLYATGIQTQALYKIRPDNGRFKSKDISGRVSFPNGITYEAANQALLIAPGFSSVPHLDRFRVRAHQP